MSTREAAAILLNSDLVKSGGPYIGPKGGKWADAKHTIPWKEPEAGGGGFSLHAAPVQQGLFGGSAFEAKPKAKPKKPDPEAHRQTDLFAAKPAPAPAKPAFAPPPAKTAMDQHAEEASAKAHAITASGDHVNGAIEHRVAAWTNRENGNDYKAREHERAAEALEKYGDLKRTAESWSKTAEKHEAEGAADKFSKRGAFGATQSHAQAIEAHTKAEAAAKAAGLHSAAAEHRAAIERHAPAEERIASAARDGAEERKRKNAYADAAAAARHWTNVASASPTGSSHAVAASAHHKAADQARASMEDSADRRRIEADHRRAAEGHADAAAKFGNPAAGKPYSDTPSERPKVSGAGDEARSRMKELAEKAKADTSYATAKKEADNASSAFDAGRGTPRTKREMMSAAQDAHSAHMKAAKAARSEGKHAEAEQHESKARAFLPDDIDKARKMMAGGYGAAVGKKTKKKPAPTHAAKAAEAMEAKESFDDAAAAAAEKIPTRDDDGTAAAPKLPKAAADRFQHMSTTAHNLTAKAHKSGSREDHEQAFNHHAQAGQILADHGHNGRNSPSRAAHDKLAEAHYALAARFPDAQRQAKAKATLSEHMQGEAAKTASKKATKIPKEGKSMGFNGAVKRYGGSGISPASQKAEDASERAQKEGTAEAHKAARDAHEAAASFHGNRRGRPDDYDAEVENHHVEAADMHSKEFHKMNKSVSVEAGLLKSQDRVAGPPPRGGVYDGLAAGLVDPAADRPRYAGRPPQQGFVAVGAVDDSRAPFAFQKTQQAGSPLELAKSAAVEALRSAYRMQLTAAEDGNPLAKLITRGRAAAELPTVPVELRKSVQQAPIDDEAVVEQAAAYLAHAAQRDPSLRDALSRAGTSRRTLRETYAAMGLTPTAVLAGY